ncbi:MAG: copper chaperone [Gemmataceae bacterium]|nr:copper chaperone [Gemmataceae bacterium]
MKSAVLAMVCLALPSLAETSQNVPLKITCQVTGLFAEDRQPDLRKVFGSIPSVKLIAIQYSKAEVTLEYAAKEFSNAKPDQVVKRLDDLVRNASRHALGIKPLSLTPREKLKLIEIQVEGLDCKGCALAAYEVVARVEGVERATASFKKGLITALVDPSKVDRGQLEKALKAREVHIKAP